MELSLLVSYSTLALLPGVFAVLSVRRGLRLYLTAARRAAQAPQAKISSARDHTPFWGGYSSTAP